jgi:hypothetical protein
MIHRRLANYVTLAATFAAPAFAQASPVNSSDIRPLVDPTVAATALDESEREPAITNSVLAALDGAFLPFTVGASTSAAYGRILSGYDGARSAFVYDGIADAHIVGGLAVRAGYASSDLSGHASALLGGRFQFLSQRQHALDLSAGLFYMPQDLEGEGLVKASLFLGRNLGAVRLFANLGYGQDPEADDGRGELALGFLVPMVPALSLGLDARTRARVFTSDEKHDGIYEPIFDVIAGPVAHYVLGPVVITGHAGWSSVVVQGPQSSARPTNDVRHGASALLAAGFVL